MTLFEPSLGPICSGLKTMGSKFLFETRTPINYLSIYTIIVQALGLLC